MQHIKHFFALPVLFWMATLGTLKSQSIYEIYNSSGGTWPSDYIILSGFSANQSVVGKSVQYRGSTSTNWINISLTGTADASGFYRIWLDASSMGAPWTPQLSDPSFAMTHTGSVGQCFQVALMNTTNTTSGTGTCPSSNIIDIVSVRGINSGTANGSPACCGAGNSESPSTTTQSHRRAGDTGDDETDFVLIDNPYVGPSCSAGTISGTTTICLGATTQLSSNGDAGGTWSSSNTTAASVNASGLVSGNAGGVSVISYTVTSGGCTSTSTAALTVNVRPTAAIAIMENNVFFDTNTGLAYHNVSLTDGILCTGPLVPSPSTNATLTASGGGTYQWSNNGSNPITVSAAGTYTVIVTNAAGCTATASRTISVNAAPDAGTISATPPPSTGNGIIPLCFNATITLNSTVPGGIWEAVNKSPSPQVVSIDPMTGLTMPLVSTINTDSHSVFYRVTSNGCKNSIRTTIEVLNPPNAGTISGTTSICSGQTTQLSSNGTTAPNTIRTWSSRNTAVATVNASSGLVTGMSAGMTTIDYTVTDFAGSSTSPLFLCTSTASVVVTVSTSSNAGTISGTTTICPNATTQLSSNGDAGGTWSSSNATAATVNPTSGLVSGMAIGTTTITYTVTANGCASSSTSVLVTVSDNVPPSITCPGNTTVSANASCQGQIGSYTAATLSDNCNLTPSVGQSPPSSTLLTGHNATQTVTLTANDGNGNTNTCTFTVTLKDQTAPIISNCPNNQFVLRNAACIAPLPDYTGVPNTSDNCPGGGVPVSQVPALGTTLNGTVTVILTATDFAGNTASCSFTATPIDQTPPSITCPANATVAANASCQGQVGSYNAATLSDNCNSMPDVTQSPPSTTTLTGHNAAQTVMLTATDGNGNTNTCTFTVTLKDVTPPNITCPNNATVNANAGCQGQIGVHTAATFSDNCNTTPGVTQSPSSSTTLNGHNATQIVTLTADDTHGNTSTCTFTVTLKDVTPPSIVCPANATVQANASCQGQIGSYNPILLADNCNNTSVTQSPVSSTLLTGHNAAQTVTLTANDGHGNTNTCTLTVTLKDVTPPNITCPGNVTVGVNSNCEGIVGTFSPTSASDNCNANPAVTQSPAASTVLNGQNATQTITLTANDGNGNTNTCSFVVTLRDMTPPTITCPGNIVRSNDPGGCGASVTYPLPVANDNCPGAGLDHLGGGLSGSTFNAGTTVVTWMATDASNLTATCSFTVTVSDTETPTIACPPNLIRNTAPGTCSAVVTYATPTASDNCTLPTGQPTWVSGGTGHATGSPNSSATFPKGTTTVQWKATDGAGSTKTCTFRVIVNDMEPPTMSCPSPINANAGAGSCSTVVTYSNPSFTDNCPPTSGTSVRTSGLPSGSSFPTGTSTVIFRATDAAGRTSTCSLQVTVTDTQLPNISCPGNVNVVGSGTPCQATAFYASATASDNCDGPLTPFLVTGLGSGSNFPAGVTTNTWRAIATNGQSSDCSFTVTVSCPVAKPAGANSLNNASETHPQTLKAALSFVPNPAISELTIAVRGLGAQGGSLSMFDALGRAVWQYALGAEQTQTTLQGLESWPKGVYMVVLHTDGQVVTRKVVLQ